MNASRETDLTSLVLDEVREDVRARKSEDTVVGYIIRRIRLAFTPGLTRPSQKMKAPRHAVTKPPKSLGRVTHHRRSV